MRKLKSINLKKQSVGIVLLLLLFSGSNELTAQNVLQKMIDKAPNGGIVAIPEGRYVIDEPLRIDARKNLTLCGQGKCKILLTDVKQYVLMVSNSYAIRLEGLYLSHLNPLKEYACEGGEISLSNSTEIIINNCEMEGSGSVGLHAGSILGLEISHCYIHDNTFNAFYFNHARDVLIQGCMIKNNANLMDSWELDDFIMSDNLIQNNGGYWRKKERNPGLKKLNDCFSLGDLIIDKMRWSDSITYSGLERVDNYTDEQKSSDVQVVELINAYLDSIGVRPVEVTDMEFIPEYSIHTREIPLFADHSPEGDAERIIATTYLRDKEILQILTEIDCVFINVTNQSYLAEDDNGVLWRSIESKIALLYLE